MPTWRTNTIAIAATLALSLPQAAVAQELLSDGATGNYRLRYVSEELGRTVEIEIVPPNKVDPKIVLTDVSRTADGRYRYTYRFANLATPRSVQPIHEVELACPGRDAAELTRPGGWVGRIGRPSARTEGAAYCRFTAIDVDVMVHPAGAADGFSVTTPWLPAIGPVNVYGYTPPVRFDADESWEHDRAIHDALRSVTGVTGGWARLGAPVPLRDPEQESVAGQLATLRSELSHVCGDAGWITDGGLCNSLGTKLEQAGRSLDRGNMAAARNQLDSFLHELDAQHGSQPGKRVGDNAYWLLKTNVEYLTARLP